MIKCAVFDLDGTLLNSHGVWTRSTTRCLENHGKKPDPDLGELLFKMNLEMAAQHLIDRYGVDRSVEELCDEIDSIAAEEYMHSLRVFDGVPKLLKELKAAGVGVTIATVTDRHCVEGAILNNGIAELVDGIVTTREAGAEKDKPDVYLKAAALCGGTAEDSIVFEDAPHGLITAGKAGFKSVGVAIGKTDLKRNEIAEVSDVVIDDFSAVSAADLFAELA